MNILEDLFYGNIRPSDKQFDRKSKYAKLLGVMTDNIDKLTGFLNSLPNAEKERDMFLEMLNAQGEINAFTELERFIEGFRLGASFMLEIFVLPQQSVIRDIC